MLGVHSGLLVRLNGDGRSAFLSGGLRWRFGSGRVADALRATNARLTRPVGTPWPQPAPGHVDTVRRHVLDPLTPAQLKQLRGIGDVLLTRLDPDGRLTGLYDPESENNGAS